MARKFYKEKSYLLREVGTVKNLVSLLLLFPLTACVNNAMMYESLELTSAIARLSNQDRVHTVRQIIKNHDWLEEELKTIQKADNQLATFIDYLSQFDYKEPESLFLYRESFFTEYLKARRAYINAKDVIKSDLQNFEEFQRILIKRFHEDILTIDRMLLGVLSSDTMQSATMQNALAILPILIKAAMIFI